MRPLRFAGKCGICGKALARGSWAHWVPKSGVYCRECGIPSVDDSSFVLTTLPDCVAEGAVDARRQATGGLRASKGEHVILTGHKRPGARNRPTKNQRHKNTNGR